MARVAIFTAAILLAWLAIANADNEFKVSRSLSDNAPRVVNGKPQLQKIYIFSLDSAADANSYRRVRLFNQPTRPVELKRDNSIWVKSYNPVSIPLW